MAEGSGNLRLIDDDILTECVSSAIHRGNQEEKGTLLRHEQETSMTVNLFSRYSIQGLSAELCCLIEFLLKYDFKNRNSKERKSSCNENFKETDNKGTEPLDFEAVFSKNPDKSAAKTTIGNSLFGDNDPGCLSKSRFSAYSERRSVKSAVCTPNLEKNEKFRRFVPYPRPISRKLSSNDISSGKNKRFNIGKCIQSVSDHPKSNPISIWLFDKKSKDINDIDTYGRCRKDNIQELIFKIYSEQHTLEDLLRCKTLGLYKPRNPPYHSRDILDQPVFVAPSPPRFMQKYVSNAIANPDMCLKEPDWFKFPEGGDCKEELFDALHVPYFEEKRGVAKELDELFSPKWNRINFI